MKKRTLDAPPDVVIFDCDGTLSTIEGVTELARQNGVFQQVCDLTEQAMATSGVNESLYKQRLDLIQPTLAQVQALADNYWENITPGVIEVIQVLQSSGKSVFVASAGIAQAVELFAQKLNISSDRVYSVSVSFDDTGNYQDFDRASPLVRQYGKAEIADDLRQSYSSIVHIGDGMNDAEAAGAVDLFVGYGGSYYRQSIADLSDVYLTEKSMTAVLPFLFMSKERI